MKTLMISMLMGVGLAACTNMPDVTRTGKVTNVIVRDDITPKDVTVSAGDEVRWINQRTGAIRVEFIDPIANRITCNNGFNRFMGMGQDQTANLGPDGTASLCFSQKGAKRYVVRMDSTTPGGETNVSGSVKVE